MNGNQMYRNNKINSYFRKKNMLKKLLKAKI